MRGKKTKGDISEDIDSKSVERKRNKESTTTTDSLLKIKTP